MSLSRVFHLRIDRIPFSTGVTGYFRPDAVPPRPFLLPSSPIIPEARNRRARISSKFHGSVCETSHQTAAGAFSNIITIAIVSIGGVLNANREIPLRWKNVLPDKSRNRVESRSALCGELCMASGRNEISEIRFSPRSAVELFVTFTDAFTDIQPEQRTTRKWENHAVYLHNEIREWFPDRLNQSG